LEHNAKQTMGTKKRIQLHSNSTDHSIKNSKNKMYLDGIIRIKKYKEKTNKKKSYKYMTQHINKKHTEKKQFVNVQHLYYL